VTQVDFYILQGDSADQRLILACRIADKAYQQEQHVLINTDSPAESARVDGLLWTFAQNSFVPHRVIDAGARDEQRAEPVLIGCGIAPDEEAWNVLINLAGEVPEFFSRYERVAEVVDGNDQRRAEGRERFRFYRDRGYELNTHRL
jgi:DNA polymerase III subunit chi